MPLAVGQKLGPYELLGLIGAGGMGEVYRARDTRLKREVAVKILPTTNASDAERVRRFEQEARAAAALNHPNILAVYDVGTANGTAYLVSELLQGESLRESLRRGGIPLRSLIEMSGQVAKALAAAHDHGVVHRDLKPENIFVTRDGTIKLLDFGLAKLLPSHGFESTKTDLLGSSEPGTVLGTLGYMSPEQVRGQEVDYRTDIFAYGAVLYEMIAGKRAFESNSAADTITAILTKDPPELPEATPTGAYAIDRIARHCLEKRPEDRFQSAHDIGFSLAMLSTASGVTSTSVAPVRASRWTRTTAAAMSVAVVSCSIFLTYRLLRPHGFSRPTYKQLTHRRGEMEAARFSRNGEEVLYSGLMGKTESRIYVGNTEEENWHALDLPPSALLSVSPTGEIALSLEGRLARAAQTGAAPKPLLDDVVAADWGNDGQIAVITHTGGRYTVQYPIGKVLYDTPSLMMDLRLSPKGDILAFANHPIRSDDRGTIDVVDLKGNHRVLTPEYGALQGVSWARDGSEIWFTAANQSPHQSLMATTLKGQVRDVLSAPGDLVLEDIDAKGRLLLGLRQRRYSIIVSDGNAENSELSWTEIMMEGGLSPDGKAVVLTDLSTGGKDYHVYLARIDGSPPLLLGEGYATDASMSADGKWVAAIRPSNLDEVELLSTGMDPNKAIRTPNFRYTRAGFTKDNDTLVVFGSDGKHSGIWTQPLSGAQLRPLLIDGTGQDGIPIEVNRRNYVCFHDAKGALTMIPIEGGPSFEVKGSSPEDEPISSRSEDANMLVYQRAGKSLRVFRVDTQTGRRETVVTLRSSDQSGFVGLSGPIPLADGKHWIFTEVQYLTSLYLAEGVN